MPPLHVAIDVAPLHGHRTGVGVATAGLLAALDRRAGVRTVPYLVSYRARPASPQRRLPLPAGVAVRAWARLDRPRVDRWLAPASLLHGTNYVAPPSRLPTVISVYDCWFLAHPDQAAPAVRRAARVLRRAVRAGARVHVSSEATGTAAAELLDTDRISVVHLGPPTAPPTAPAPPAWLGGRPFLVAIGTTERRKAIPDLVRAFGVVAAAVPDLDLVVAGAPGDDHRRVLEERGRLDATSAGRVHVTGTVDTATRDALLTHAAALVYPSLDEGFGFPVLEAHQAGIAVVARRAGSIPEVAGDAAELVEPGSVEALAAGIRHVLEHPDRRAELVAAGTRNLARFSWDRCAEEMMTVYRTSIEEQA